ncbi:MAG: sulfotransferase [bacterium]
MQKISFMVLGHPRSGTNFLSAILRSHPDVSFITEPFSMHNGFIRLNFFKYWGEESYIQDIFHKDMRDSQASVRFFAEFKKWLMSGNEEVRVFKETTFLMKLKWLKQYLPELNIIYIQRDPKGVVISFKKSGLFLRWNYQEIFYRLSEESKIEHGLSQYAQIIEETSLNNWIDVLTTLYYIATNEARNNLELFRHTNVVYEHLATNTLYAFAEIFNFLGLSISAEVEKEIAERCSETKGGIFSTFRNSRETCFRYKYLLTQEENNLIETKMKRWT